MNKVSHFEIPFDDQARAQKFYSEVFGWEINKFGDMDYWIVKTCNSDQNMKPVEPGAINGGLLKRDETSKNPVIVVDVPDIKEHLKKIESAGGKIVMPTIPIGDFGLYSRIADTEGNVIGVWQLLKKEHH
ncbi:MAG: VOC family protein [Thaumarchaeota archaeon]|nr:VOC family protein [Nitrososphaerota archaeon]